ncbi:MAG: TetR/AcrR family transcriptional regulator [Chloroflexi bacterium]|nr:TetR/AcrR family transcriptional regulator [Chloroflexota bacterium]
MQTPQKPFSPRVSATRARILRAASQEFGARGYNGATTRAIAGAAGVSELTLFRHFETKENLFQAVLEQYSPLATLQSSLSAVSGDPHQDLLQIGASFYRAILERREVILLSLHEAGQFPEMRQLSRGIPRQLRHNLAGYLRAQMDSGRLRKTDPELAAQAFLGMFFAYALNNLLQGEAIAPHLEEEITAFFVSLFLDGMILRE